MPPIITTSLDGPENFPKLEWKLLSVQGMAFYWFHILKILPLVFCILWFKSVYCTIFLVYHNITLFFAGNTLIYRNISPHEVSQTHYTSVSRLSILNKGEVVQLKIGNFVCICVRLDCIGLKKLTLEISIPAATPSIALKVTYSSYLDKLTITLGNRYVWMLFALASA